LLRGYAAAAIQRLPNSRRRHRRGNAFTEKSLRSRPFRSHENRCAGLRHRAGL